MAPRVRLSPHRRGSRCRGGTTSRRRRAAFSAPGRAGHRPHEELAKSLLTALPPGDAYRAVYREEPIVTRLMVEGRTGRRAKGGFYDDVGDVLDLESGDYRPAQTVALEEFGGACHESAGAGRQSIGWWALCARGAADYAGRRGLSGSRYRRCCEAVDTAMRLGLGWTWGPFEFASRARRAPPGRPRHCGRRAVPCRRRGERRGGRLSSGQPAARLDETGDCSTPCRRGGW